MSTEKRDKVISFRVTGEQYARIHKRAQAEGLQVADYSRSVLVGPRLLELQYLLIRGMIERLHLLVQDTTRRQAVEKEFARLIEEVEEAEEGEEKNDDGDLE